MSEASEYLPNEGEIDLLAEDGNPKGSELKLKKPRPIIEFYSPSQLRNHEPPKDQNMLGDFHLQRGAPSVLAGPPGCGKSRATLWLAILGARGSGNWFGFEVHSQFRTLIVQSENGLTRLHRDFEHIEDVETLDDWIRISSFPCYTGFAFGQKSFRDALKKAIHEFQPHLVIFDPWNNVTEDAMEKNYMEAFDRIKEVMADSPNASCLILHHLRKPRAEDKQRGRGLANLLSGSYVLGSVARSVLVMQPASDDTEDSRVVITPAKNNDGDLGKRTAWERKAGWFEPVDPFDFEDFDSGGGGSREPKVKEEHILDVFEHGKRWCKQKEAAESLQVIASVGRSAAYDALKPVGGRFSHLITRDPKTGNLGLLSSATNTGGDDAEVI